MCKSTLKPDFQRLTALTTYGQLSPTEIPWYMHNILIERGTCLMQDFKGNLYNGSGMAVLLI